MKILVQKKTNKFGYQMFVVNVFIIARRGDILRNKQLNSWKWLRQHI